MRTSSLIPSGLHARYSEQTGADSGNSFKLPCERPGYLNWHNAVQLACHGKDLSVDRKGARRAALLDDLGHEIPAQVKLLCKLMLTAVSLLPGFEDSFADRGGYRLHKLRLLSIAVPV